ncbi:MAG TPA: DNA gyrase inhibitor YacG [Rhizomicrobium sp.]|nr:DNA gyrase inhibitor YacG [Rhizomicrobium sp.]
MSQPGDAGACPVCGKPRDAKLRPFCSRRCKDVDLARWLSGDYAIPGAPAGEGNEPPPEEDPELH